MADQPEKVTLWRRTPEPSRPGAGMTRWSTNSGLFAGLSRVETGTFIRVPEGSVGVVLTPEEALALAEPYVATHEENVSSRDKVRVALRELEEDESPDEEPRWETVDEREMRQVFPDRSDFERRNAEEADRD